MLREIKELMIKYKQVIMYLIFGVLTTIINILSYELFVRVFNTNYLISTIIAWIISVCFAYITNKIWVFESNTKNKLTLFKELFDFFKYRILSCIIDLIIMYVLVSVLKINDSISKITSNIVVVIINYIFSKFIIFKKDSNDFKLTKKDVVIKILIYLSIIISILVCVVVLLNCVIVRKYIKDESTNIIDSNNSDIVVSIGSIISYKNTFKIEGYCYKNGENIDNVNSFIVLRDNTTGSLYKVNTDMVENPSLKNISSFDYSKSAFIAVGANYGLDVKKEYSILVCYGNNYSKGELIDSGKTIKFSKEELNEKN